MAGGNPLHRSSFNRHRDAILGHGRAHNGRGTDGVLEDTTRIVTETLTERPAEFR